MHTRIAFLFISVNYKVNIAFWHNDSFLVCHKCTKNIGKKFLLCIGVSGLHVIEPGGVFKKGNGSDKGVGVFFRSSGYSNPTIYLVGFVVLNHFTPSRWSIIASW